MKYNLLTELKSNGVDESYIIEELFCKCITSPGCLEFKEPTNNYAHIIKFKTDFENTGEIKIKADISEDKYYHYVIDIIFDNEIKEREGTLFNINVAGSHNSKNDPIYIIQCATLKPEEGLFVATHFWKRLAFVEPQETIRISYYDKEAVDYLISTLDHKSSEDLIKINKQILSNPIKLFEKKGIDPDATKDITISKISELIPYITTTDWTSEVLNRSKTK